MCIRKKRRDPNIDDFRTVRKGGVNPDTTTPQPPPPVGQGGIKSKNNGGKVSMKEINKASEIIPFIGQIVAFTVSKNCYIMGLPDEGWTIVSNPGLFFGFIEQPVTGIDFGEFGFNMSRFKSHSSVFSNCALIGSKIQGAGLRMRLATDDEIQILKTAFDKGEATFEYHTDWPKVQTFGEHQIELLERQNKFLRLIQS